MKSRILFFFTIILIIYGCEKDADDKDDTPSVKTLSVEVLEDGGVILSGVLDNQQAIINHGFVLSGDSLFMTYPTWIYYLDAPEKAGVFKKEIGSGLKTNQVYFFKAFIETENRKVFGLVKPFLSEGSKVPKITEIIPEKAHVADTISIIGHNFGRDARYASIFMGDKKTRIISYSDTLIKCQIPEDLSAKEMILKVNCFDKKDSVLYALHKPVIKNFSPAQATFRDTVWITGEHFDFSTQRNKIHLGSVEAEIISSSRNKIGFIVPDEFDKSKIEIDLFTQVQRIQSTNTFNLLPPEIISIPESAYSNTELVIEGKFFHPDLRKNKILIEGIEVKLISGTVDQLIVKIPYGPFPRGYADIQLNVEVFTIKATSDLFISDKWLMISNSLPFGYYREVGTFTLKETAYVISNSKDYTDDNTYLWEYKDDTNEWLKYDIPFEFKNFGICSSANDKGYVYTATKENNFWEFDPDTKNWTQKTNFPGARRDGAASFSIGNGIYIGIGADFEPYSEIVYRDFYCFDPLSNSWTRIEDLGIEKYWGRTETSTFVINDVAYLLGGARHTGMHDVWAYSTNTKEWSRVADFPNAMSYTSSFSLNGKGYIANGASVGGSETKYCWEYIPENNEWSRTDNIGYKGRFGGFAFVINNTAYVGGGSGGSYNDLTEYELYRLSK
ncbi:IPT/TIG domain-containing protein [Ancylomarina sp. YFZ004]